MSVETELAELRMQERELLNTPCAGCGHELAMHSRISTPTCKSWSHKGNCSCRGFVETTDEQLAL